MANSQLIKNNSLLVFFLVATCMVWAQPNLTDSIYIQKKECAYPTGTNVVDYLVRTSTGAYFGTRISPTNFSDLILIRLDSTSFDTLWVKTIGENSTAFWEKPLIELPNGNLLLVGVTQAHFGFWQSFVNMNTAMNLYTLIIDTNGNILKKQAFGGHPQINLGNVYMSSTHDIYVCGAVTDSSHDFTHSSMDGYDAFIFKFDVDMNIIWKKYFSTDNGVESIQDIREGVNNQELMCAMTCEDDTSINNGGSPLGGAYKGDYDGIMIKIDTAGNMKWAKRIGGSNGDALSRVFTDKINKRYYFVGTTTSVDGDIQYKTGNVMTQSFGVYDYNAWVVVCDTGGNNLHSKAYGTKVSIANPNIFGYSTIVDATFYNGYLWVADNYSIGGGDLPPYNPGFRENAWIFKADSQANLRAKLILNTVKDDYIRNFFYRDGYLCVRGLSGHIPDTTTIPNFLSCDTIQNIGYILQLGDAPLGIDEEFIGQSEGIKIYPNPTSNSCIIEFPQTMAKQKINLSLTNMDGKMVFKDKFFNNGKYDLNIKDYSKGLYIITVQSSKGIKYSKKLLIE